ncbi:MAG: hypothetical protein AMS25_12860 [Gemmatimonas sp. SM23_52]|jgi:sulfoxide reductase heme-binding subunit YedZ|nr:MAG: hypothetical protein AMS25_12860 [Gemmatimonas sp. SM23_52]
MTERRKLLERTLRVGVFLGALVPLARILVHALTGGLGTNPIEELLHRTGWWALAFLMLTLSVTPARQLTGWGALIKLRRMLGLYAFFYASLHFGIYLGLDQFFAVEYILADITDRPYITVGFAALLILIPLAVTSTKGWIKRLGGKRWNRLHKLVYLAAALGVLHFLWLVKADMREPAIFGWILVTLLSYRLLAERLRQRKLRRAKRQGATAALDADPVPARTR